MNLFSPCPCYVMAGWNAEGIVSRFFSYFGQRGGERRDAEQHSMRHEPACELSRTVWMLAVFRRRRTWRNTPKCILLAHMMPSLNT